MSHQTAHAPSAPEPTTATKADPPAPATPRPRSSWWQHQLHVMGQRRHFFVHRSQMRAAALITAITAVLLIGLNLTLHYGRVQNGQLVVADSPELGQLIATQNNLEAMLVGIGTVVVLVAVFFVSILETHKTAGASLHLNRVLEQLACGEFWARARLRKDDNLRDVEEGLNELARGLERRAEEEIARMQAFADTATSLAGPDEAARLAQELRDHAETWGRRTSRREL